MLAVGPSMANIVAVLRPPQGVRAVGVSPNPLHRNPSYEPVGNPDRRSAAATSSTSSGTPTRRPARSSSRRQLADVREPLPRPRRLHVHRPRAAAAAGPRRRAGDPDLRGAPEVIRAPARPAALVAARRSPRPPRAADPMPATPIKHFVVLMQENHTFDNYFGTYPGADGLPPNVCMPNDARRPDRRVRQAARIGDTPTLDLRPQRPTSPRRSTTAARWTASSTPSPRRGHRRRAQPMGYYDDRDLPYYWNIADNYVLFDRFFVLGGRRQRLEPHVLGHRHARQPGADDAIPPDGFDTTLPTIFDRLEAARASRGSSTSRTTTRRITLPNPATSATAAVAADLGAAARLRPLPRRPEALLAHRRLSEYYEDLARHAAGRVVHRARRAPASTRPAASRPARRSSGRSSPS